MRTQLIKSINFVVSILWKENDKKSMGVIAQELQKVFPELVAEENDELSVNYNGLIAVLIETVKELSKDKSSRLGLINKKVRCSKTVVL